jgi:hypothetical protein
MGKFLQIITKCFVIMDSPNGNVLLSTLFGGFFVVAINKVIPSGYSIDESQFG